MATEIEYPRQAKVPAPTREKPRPLASLQASAYRLKSTSINKTFGTATRVEEWQEEAWNLYDLVGEQHYLGSTLANRMAQARIFVGKRPSDPTEEVVPIESGPEAEVLNTLTPYLQEMIARWGVNLFVAGDCWLVGTPRDGGSVPAQSAPVEPATRIPPTGSEAAGLDDIDLADLEWSARSVSEIKFDQDGRVTIIDGQPSSRAGDAGGRTYDLDEVFLARIWRPHPRFHWQADAPTRSVMPILREIVGLTMHVGAQIDSRLAGAGLFVYPSEAKAEVASQFEPTDADDVIDLNTVDREQLDQEDPLMSALMTAMIEPISNRDSASAVVPLVMTMPAEYIDKIRQFTFGTELDDKAQGMTESAVVRLARSQDCPPELLLGSGCADTATEILTQRGWQTLDTLHHDDIVLTLNTETGQSQWQAMEAINVYDVVDEPMLRMAGKGVDSLTTMNHRWAVIDANTGKRKIITSGKLNSSHRIPTAALNADLPTEAVYSDAFVELVGWYWTEGSTGVYKTARGRMERRTQIAQSASRNPDRVARIRASLNEVFGEGHWGNEHQRSTRTGYGDPVVTFNLRNYVGERLDEVAPEKIVSLGFVRSLTRAQLELFIEVSCLGDGWHGRRGGIDIWQRDPEVLEAYELALILSGRMVSNTEHADGFVVNGWRKSTIRPVKAGQTSQETYTGKVWCPTTPNGTWMMRRGGQVAFTGNSLNHWGAWLVKEDVVTTHLEPPLALICDALTMEFLWPVLKQGGMSEEQAEDRVVWYDVDHLVLRPNRTQDAKDLHSVGALNDVALRDAAGFDESDAPEQGAQMDEAVRIALDMVSSAPSLAQDPGLPLLVQQIRDVLAGKPTDQIPVPVEGAPEAPGEAGGEESSPDSGPAGTGGTTDGGGVPATSDSPASGAPGPPPPMSGLVSAMVGEYL